MSNLNANSDSFKQGRTRNETIVNINKNNCASYWIRDGNVGDLKGNVGDLKH
jgi:hypothetical protein